MIVKDPQTGQRLPTGFVQLNSIQTATEALESLNGTQTAFGESLVLSYARPRRFQSHGFGEPPRRAASGSFGGNRGARRSPPTQSRSRWDD